MNELEKWDKVHEDVVTINTFMEFLDGKGLTVCRFDKNTSINGGQFLPTLIMRDDLIATHFDIDLIQLDKERKELLEKIRNEEDLE